MTQHDFERCVLIVLDRHDLRGRAIASESGFDDRVVEILKIAIAGSAKMQGSVAIDAVCTVNLIGLEGDDLVFSVSGEDSSLTAVMPRGAYDLYNDALLNSSLRCDQPYLVDKAWATRALEVFDQEGAFES